MNTLQRTAFKTSRLMEFFSEKELQMQIGHESDAWPIALVKELIDNSLDACESKGIAPKIHAELESDAVSVADNGPGLPEEILRQSLDYSLRVSDKNHYIAPTRGQLGNALKTVWAAPFVASGNEHGQVEVQTNGEHYTADVSLDRIKQEPKIALNKEASPVKNGTVVKMHWPGVASYLDKPQGRHFLQPVPTLTELVDSYPLFNPHMEMGFDGRSWSPTDSNWRKWNPSEPTSPHWYSTLELENLIAAYLGAGKDKTVRGFVSEFRGLSSTQRTKKVVEDAGLSGQRLSDLKFGDGLDTGRVNRLLNCMQRESRPVKADQLGVIGGAHIKRWMEAHDITVSSVKYVCKKWDALGSPYVLELAFGVFGQTAGGLGRSVFAGLNWTPALSSPFAELNILMNECWVQVGDPVCVVVHLACPKLAFTDRGKSRVSLPGKVRDDFSAAFKSITQEWTKLKKQTARQERIADRQLDKFRKWQKAQEWTIKDACYHVMEKAYQKASSNGRFPANARQIMYAARPLVLELTGGEFYKHSASFTQGILPEFQADYPELTASWDVVYDDRGHLTEPHTDTTIGLGTLAVRRYMKGWTNGRVPSVEAPSIRKRITTSGPCHRYSAVLFVEKEGFNEALKDSHIAEKYDIAIQSTKGQTVTAARQLAERYAEMGIPVFVLHDFDKSGIEIVANYRNSTRRHQYDTRPLIIDIGLRLDDVKALGLEEDGAEEVTYSSEVHPQENLRACGATEEEIKFLVQGGRAKDWVGKRVELNALPTEHLIEFIERKLQEHGVKKVTPDDKYLTEFYKWAVKSKRMQERIDELFDELENEEDEKIEVPEDLRQRLEKQLEDDRTQSWDAALFSLAGEEE